MAVKIARSPVAEVAAYFALVLDVEPVQLVEPIRNGLAIPTKRHVLGIVDGGIAISFFSISIALRVHGLLLQLPLLKDGCKEGEGQNKQLVLKEPTERGR